MSTTPASSKTKKKSPASSPDDQKLALSESDNCHLKDFGLKLNRFTSEARSLSETELIIASRSVICAASRGALPTWGLCKAVLAYLMGVFPARSFKYKSTQELLRAYPAFVGIGSEELDKLHKSANWMDVLFKLIPSKKNKGLSLRIVTDLVEGEHVRYITGSGQSQATSHRVMIYEKEGNVEPFRRNRNSSPPGSSQKAAVEVNIKVEPQLPATCIVEDDDEDSEMWDELMLMLGDTHLDDVRSSPSPFSAAAVLDEEFFRTFEFL